MTRKIQAYFLTEDDTENVKTKLQTYDTEILEVGPLKDKLSPDIPLLAPFAAGSSSGTGTGAYEGGASVPTPASSLGAYFGMRELKKKPSPRDGEKGNAGKVEDFTAVVSVEVNDRDYEEIVDMIRRNRGHINVSD